MATVDKDREDAVLQRARRVKVVGRASEKREKEAWRLRSARSSGQRLEWYKYRVRPGLPRLRSEIRPQSLKPQAAQLRKVTFWGRRGRSIWGGLFCMACHWLCSRWMWTLAFPTLNTMRIHAWVPEVCTEYSAYKHSITIKLGNNTLSRYLLFAPFRLTTTALVSASQRMLCRKKSPRRNRCREPNYSGT